MPKQNLTIRVSDDLRERIERYAAARDVTTAAAVRIILSETLIADERADTRRRD